MENLITFDGPKAKSFKYKKYYKHSMKDHILELFKHRNIAMNFVSVMDLSGLKESTVTARLSELCKENKLYLSGVVESKFINISLYRYNPKFKYKPIEEMDDFQLINQAMRNTLYPEQHLVVSEEFERLKGYEKVFSLKLNISLKQGEKL